MDLREVIEEHDRLLACEPQLGPELFARLHADMRALDLVYGGRELGVALRPHFLARQRYEELARAARVVLGALEKVTAAAVAEPRVAAELGLDERARRLVAVDPGYAPAVLHARLDAFVSEGSIGFLECNAENPSGLTDQHGLNRVLFRLRALQEIGARYRLRQFDPLGRLVSAVARAHRDRGGTAPPRIAIVDWAGVPTAQEFAPLRNGFVTNAMPAIVCAPEELEYERGTLRRGSFAIDIVFKRVIIAELLDRLGEGHALVRAYVAGDVGLVNSLRCTIAHRKAAFALLTDEDHSDWFTPLEAETLARCVPWTRRLRECRTGHRGRTIELLPWARAHRAELVLKPSDAYGGRGVVLGSALDESGWDAALDACLRGDYVVQQAVRPQVLEFPIFAADGWAMRAMHVDTDPFVIDGHVEGAMVRLSASPIVNVTAGGGETGFLVLEPSE